MPKRPPTKTQANTPEKGPGTAQEIGGHRPTPGPVASRNIDGAGIRSCLRCGTCCRKGGPTLHLQDRPLFEKGVLSLAHLYTLRKGQWVYDNFQDTLVQLDQEMIKIKSLPGQCTCMFYQEPLSACSIYRNRPLQCRALKCWDTRELEEVFKQPKLTRKDLLPPDLPALEILKAHDRRCSYALLDRETQRLGGLESEQAVRAIIDVLQYDQAIRPFMARHLGIDPSSLEFFFGRPLSLTIQAYGLKVKKQGRQWHLVPDSRLQDTKT